jgi:hypothetical protein
LGVAFFLGVVCAEHTGNNVMSVATQMLARYLIGTRFPGERLMGRV